jgi:two-component system, cell cycle sensor histidine kinase and response regulator CckA
MTTRFTLFEIAHPHVPDDQLQQLQKLEAVGRLAGGVAHDFNNLLTIILNCCELLAGRHPGDQETTELLDDIRCAGERGVMLTRQLLSFSRKQPARPEVLDLNEVISNLAQMLRRLIGENIDLRTRLEPDIGAVLADQGQVEQIVVNLAVNARDAMPKGGALTIETRRTEILPGSREAETGIPPAVYTTLTVRDGGCGMSGEVLSHLFEPFFTTKETGKGTGLGLCTVYGIVKQFGGHIRVASKPGVGSRFRIFFPRVDAVPAPAAVKRESRPATAGEGTILLVEDEGSLRSLVGQVLRLNGFQVLEAGDGAEALTVADAFPAPIDLLVTDVIMPLMSGPQLASALGPRRPQMRVLYTSGYTDSLLAPHNEQDIRASFLPKPYRPNDLMDAVHRAFAAPPPRRCATMVN